MKNLSFLAIIFAAIFVFASVSAAEDEIQPADYSIRENILYNEQNKLDVYYDKNNGNKPVIIYIHGGYWYEGDKEEDSRIGTLLQTHDYVVVIPNYRLYPEVTSINDMVEDVYSAIKWTVENISQFGGDKDEMSIVGFNAGGHLASLTLLKSALKMEVNDKKLKTLATFKHLILFNSPYTFEKDEKLEAEIRGMRNTASMSPNLEYLNKFADAKEGLFLGKSSTIYDEVEILSKKGDLSIYSMGADKITFVECDNDTNYPIGSSQEMMEEVKRVVDDVEIVKQVYPGNYDYIISGIKGNNEEVTSIFLSLIGSVYESH
ncbi:alpha/beta-hydrolase [Anaeromyces robustus]|uniref:Alpha/beta-hydrolase n=1 Tax=Anaeromyces robustus TaxID=1754192 RepID=A0A1Y1WQG9_9FUNG|nr:alpha/beta-hydrolase [Anaeromyces robustus]|eukprot:ORX75770.1 alpha/beta-hydrolase [Anaeromyces robustus]